jgi:hypothetical protein
MNSETVVSIDRLKYVSYTPNELDELGHLFARDHASVSKILSDSKSLRSAWIDRSIVMMQRLRQIRDKFPRDQEFGAWIRDKRLNFYGHTEQAALLGLSTDIELARKSMNETTSYSYRVIWDENKSRFPGAGKPQATRNNRKKKSKSNEMTDKHAFRLMKLEDDLSALANTALGSPKEIDALILIKDHKPEVYADLVQRAISGEPVSAIAWLERKKLKPAPTGAELKQIWSTQSHRLLSAWLRADPKAQNELLKYMEEHRRG